MWCDHISITLFSGLGYFLATSKLVCIYKILGLKKIKENTQNCLYTKKVSEVGRVLSLKSSAVYIQRRYYTSQTHWLRVLMTAIQIYLNRQVDEYFTDNIVHESFTPYKMLENSRLI